MSYKGGREIIPFKCITIEKNQVSFKLNMQRITSRGTPRVYDIPTLVPTVLAFSIMQH